MARGKGGPEGSGKIKFRFVEFEMDGNDSTLEEGLKSIAAALNRGIGPGSVKMIRHNGADATTKDVPAETPDEMALDEENPEEEGEARTPRAPAAPRKISPRRVVESFKLDDVSPTLKEFAAEKEPQSDLKKYLVIAHWAKEYKKMEELTPDHFYTAYKHMSWTSPKDFAQPMRDLINPRVGRFSTGSASGTAKINHLGENAVMEMGKGA
jgi:hypothetical protein